MPFPGDPDPQLQNVANNPGLAPSGTQDTEMRPMEPEQTKIAPEPWDDDLALQVAVGDFNRAETHRSQNFDQRWNDNDRIYQANVPQRFWEGTNVPRASIGVKLTWQQVESLLPRVLDGLFSSPDGIFFECFPRPGTDPQQAIANREFIAYQMDEAQFRETMRLIAKSAAIHGTGVMKVSWRREERDREAWDDQIIPRLKMVRGIPVALDVTRRFKRKKFKQEVNQPNLEYVSIRDFYIDPAHKRPRIEGATYVCQRALVPLTDLLNMAENDPSFQYIEKFDGSKKRLSEAKEELLRIIRMKETPRHADADQQKQVAAMEAGIYQSRPIIGSTDIAAHPFEVIEYWTKDRLVTLLDRKMVIRNIPNPYGFIPFLSIVYTDVLDEFYGKGLAEILEPEQRIQQGILNSRLDELSLIIHGQLVYQEGAVIGKHQLRPRPGGAIGVTGDVNAAVKHLERSPVTGEAFVEVQQSSLRAQAYTGVTDLVVQGSPSVPTSATRTRFGVSTLAQAALGRIQYLIENISEQMVIPMLNMVYALNTRYLDPRQPLQILGKMGQLITIDPTYITGGQYRFEMRAAARLTARQAMAQSLPFVLQTVLNPALISAMQEEGTVPNVQAIVRDMLEVLGWRNRNDWFRQLSQEEQQARQQRQMTPEMIKFMKEKMRLSAKDEMESQRQMADIFKSTLEQAYEDAPGSAAAALGLALDDAGAS